MEKKRGFGRVGKKKTGKGYKKAKKKENGYKLPRSLGRDQGDRVGLLSHVGGGCGGGGGGGGDVSES
ncbi:hypothetical protein E2C01_075473 [Portunus trituberculatus]|uniref:Uncharacterized protein n=1 Tax=Portunus trituberculatus TaxID=210409 RepID=A0A5B7IH48_PORTR|nr:hypothetical protein [Portunus trituberculatus]